MSKKNTVARRAQRTKKTPKAEPRPSLRARISNRLDRLAAWLNRRSRPARILISALIALILAVAAGLFLFEAVFPITYEAPTSPQSNMTEVFTATMVGLVVVGLAFYWIGWRVLVGFDFGDRPLKPGRAGALWVCLGLFTLLGILAIALIGLLQAVAPT